MESTTCLELALEGERLCKAGDFLGGVAFFEAAIQVGTDDLKTLSAIYSQLGNAYFYVGNYAKAMEYHKLDLTVARAICDRVGEAKASGNLGNSLKMMGKFDEAILCCGRHLHISRELQDKVGESRALYNLGNVYHTKGKHIAGIGHQDPGEFPEEVKACLQKAVDYYEENLKLMTELGDRLAQGRAYGNLGNTHYLLGNFSQAIVFHQKRLKLAKEFGDKSAERRAYNNLGNAHIFLGEFEKAAEFFKKTLFLAEELGDRAVEAQACYSLGNTYTLLRDYPLAIEHHLRHLRIARDLQDKMGESRANWSLGNAYTALGSHEKALHYATRHLELAKEIGDCNAQVTAQISISDLRKMLGFSSLQSTPTTERDPSCGLDATPSRKNRYRRSSMENLELMKLTPETRVLIKESKDELNCENKENVNTQNAISSSSGDTSGGAIPKVSEEKTAPMKTPEGVDDETFFELLERFQKERMDDQRCSVELLSEAAAKKGSGEPHSEVSAKPLLETVQAAATANALTPPQASPKRNYKSSPDNLKVQQEDLFDLIAGMQSRRMDEQRATLPGDYGNQEEGARGPDPDEDRGATGNHLVHPQDRRRHSHEPHHRMSVDTSAMMPDDDFFEMLMRCQGTRIEDQRSSMPDLGMGHHPQVGQQANCVGVNPRASSHGSTMPDDDFFTLILRFQGGRIEDQRSFLPSAEGSGSNSKGSTLERAVGGSLRQNRTGGSLLKSSLKHGLRGTRMSK